MITLSLLLIILYIRSKILKFSVSQPHIFIVNMTHHEIGEFIINMIQNKRLV